MKKLILLSLTIIILAFVLKGQDSNYNYKVFKLLSGELLIPSSFLDSSKSIDLFIHLHGKASIVQDAFLRSKLDGILFTIHLGMFSSPYRTAFSDTNYFKIILDEIIERIEEELRFKISENQLKIFMSSFSAGYAGIREILKQENYYQKIYGIILLDGLHTDYIDTEQGRIVNPIQMKDYLRFARDAINFKRKFLITHSEIIPEDYSSTTETAHYLIDSTNSEKIFDERYFNEGFVQKYYVFNGKFRVIGFYGDKASDHMKHLYNLDKFLRMLKE